VSGIALIAIPAAVLGLGGYFASVQLSREQIDANYCYAREDQHQVAVFVDFSLTHQTTDSQRRDLLNTLSQVFTSMPPNGQLSVFTTEKGKTATVVSPQIVLCNPAETARDLASFDGPKTGAPKLARQHEEAVATFETALEDLMVNSTNEDRLASSSPILEQIQGISRYDFGAPLSRLVVYTDGINNSAAGQFCAKQGHLPRFEIFAGRPEYQYVRPERFRGGDVDVLLVENIALPQPGLDHCTHAELRAFWREYFENNGAGTVRLTPLGLGA